MAKHLSAAIPLNSSARAANFIVALSVVVASLVGCGGGGGGGDGGSEGDSSSTPAIPAHPNYRQKVLALFAASYTLDCSTGGSSTKVQRVVALAQDGVVRATGLADVDLSGEGSTVTVLASYLQHPVYNSLAPGVYVTGTSPHGSANMEFSFVEANTLRLMKLSYTTGGTTTSCLTAPTIGGANPPNTVAWNGPAFLDDAAFASHSATCMPSQGSAYTIDLTLGTKVSQMITVPIAPSTSSAEDAFAYLSTDSDGSKVKVEVRGESSPARTLTWHGVSCSF